MLTCKQLHIGHQKLLFEVPELHFEGGELITLLGPNGSGKTTFLKTLLGTISPLKGEVCIAGASIASRSASERIKLISHVGSRFDGLPYLTVGEYVALGRAPYTNLIHQLTPNDKLIISNNLERVGLSHLRNQSTHLLSDGERQLAAIAKALCQETNIILLDEPSAFLDYPNRIKILELLSRLAKEERKIILLSSHDIELCLEFATHIIGVNSQTKLLTIFTKGISKAALLSRIFG